MNTGNHTRNPKDFEQPFRFRCTQCGKCCADPKTLVNLTYSDILRLHWDLEYDLNRLMEIIGFYIFENDLTDEQRNQLVVPPIQTEQGPAFIALRKRTNGRCIFLNHKNQCSIYHARPDICRTFPFHFQASQDQSSQEAGNIDVIVTQKAIEYCEGFIPTEDPIDLEYWRTIGKMTIDDISKEKLLINRWNSAVSEGKITPNAKNYVKIILNQIEDTPKKQKVPTKKVKPKSLKQRAREKLQKK